jgi:hypothetical protein
MDGLVEGCHSEGRRGGARPFTGMPELERKAATIVQLFFGQFPHYNLRAVGL